MPYGKSYRYRRYRYRRSKLTNRNIFMNRNARSQAIQIASLRNKVNKVYKAAKPERKVKIDSQPTQVPLTSDTGGQTYASFSCVAIQPAAYDTGRIGDKIWRRDTFYITAEYFNNSSTGYHNGESAGTPIRVICGRYKNKSVGGSTVPTPQTIFSMYDTTGTPSTISVISPLKNGVTEEQQIFYDKAFTMTSARNQKLIKVKTPWYLCRFNSDEESNHSWLMVKAGGLHWDLDFTETVQLVVMRKTVFTDA